ncbi:hypothetical protein ACPF7Z_14220 [Halomonas sp. GXIMD04776]
MVTPVKLQRYSKTGVPLFLATMIITVVSIDAAFASEEADPVLRYDTLSDLNGLSADELDQFRGRENIDLVNVQSIQDLKTIASGNSVNAGSVFSGPITIESRSLDSFDGVGLFNIMTGHNNAVTSAVGISIYLAE